ncbi:MAG: pseudouridine synthase [Phycisphaerales bacterium]|nr:pseudouridine synthase [Phycisphaerales bacterium]
MPSMSLPYLTRDFPGVGGVIKQRPEDFFVQEIPLYEPSGEGEHVYCEIQKAGITTFQAVDRIAAALRVYPREIGYAGLKDAKALTRQTFSILGTTPEAVMGLKLPGITVLWAARHGNKLRLGHLAGNRFALKIREVNPTDVVKIKSVLPTLEKRGMPNYFGEQRFGYRGDNDLLGAAFVRGDSREILRLLIGNPMPAIDDAQTLVARTAFDRQDLDTAMRVYPRRHGMERQILARLIKTHRPSGAIWLVDHKLRRLWVSALQSRVFNEVVAKRIDALDKLLKGDLAWKHDSGAVFRVEQPEVEQPRCDAFEVSPTGPLVGYRMTLPEGEPLETEQALFETFKLKPADFRRTDGLKVKGARRPLRVQPKDVDLAGGVDEHGGHITVAFTLPPGSFATVLLREIMKSPEVDAPPAQPEEAEESAANEEANPPAAN